MDTKLKNKITKYPANILWGSHFDDLDEFIGRGELIESNFIKRCKKPYCNCREDIPTKIGPYRIVVTNEDICTDCGHYVVMLYEGEEI